MRATLIDLNGLVVNVIIIGEGWNAPDGFTLGPDGGQIGDTWDGEKYVRPVVVEDEQF